MADKSDSTLKSPKGFYKQLEELAQKNQETISSQYTQLPDEFLALLTVGGETYTGTGSNKTSARDNAAEEALEPYSIKVNKEKKAVEKTPVTKLSEVCQKNTQIKHTYEELGKDGDMFVCRVTLTHGNGEGNEKEEHIGRGSSKKEAKQKSASFALQNSVVLQSLIVEIPTVGRSYECKPSQTGYVLVVYFTKDRDWADVDVKNIKDLMEIKLKFHCIVKKDPTKSELIDVLEATSRDLNKLSDSYYCFMFFLMGHGGQFGVRTADKGKKKITITVEEILEYFKNDKVPGFTGKPKAFFIQSCRGELYQESVLQPDNDDEGMDIISVPTDGDIMIAYATTEGYKSFRRKNFGSIFIFNCIKIFETNYSSVHLEEMMIDVKAEIALDPKWRRTDQRTQMPCTWSTFTKRLFLMPTDS